MLKGGGLSQQEVGRGSANLYLAQLQVRKRTGINEGLGNDGEAGVDMVSLVDVKDKLGVLQNVDPESQR